MAKSLLNSHDCCLNILLSFINSVMFAAPDLRTAGCRWSGISCCAKYFLSVGTHSTLNVKEYLSLWAAFFWPKDLLVFFLKG